MRLFGGYILRQIAATSGIAVLIMLFAFILERTLRLIREIGLSALSPDLAVGMILCRVPEILVITLPPAFFAGVLLTFQRLAKDSELNAIYASGLGLIHMIRPLLLLTGGVAALSIVLLWLVLPHSKYNFRVLMNEATQSAFTEPFKMGSFIRFNGNVLYVAASKDDAGELGDSFFYERGERGEIFVTTAASGDFELSNDQRSLFLSAHEGRRVTIPDHGQPSSFLTFGHVRKLIYSFDRGNFPKRGFYVSELTLRELYRALKQGRDDGRKMQLRARLHSRLARVLQVFLLPILAIPLALCFPTSRHWLAIAIGAVLVLAIDQGLIFGETVASRGQVSPWLGIWGILACFAGIAGVLITIAKRRDQDVRQ